MANEGFRKPLDLLSDDTRLRKIPLHKIDFRSAS